MVALSRPRPVCPNCQVPRHDDTLCRRCRRMAEVRNEFGQWAGDIDREEDSGYSARARRYQSEWAAWTWLHADMDRFGPLWRSRAALGRGMKREPTPRIRRPQRGSEGASKLLRETLANGDSMPAVQYAAVIGVYQMGLAIRSIARTWGKRQSIVQQAINGACRRFGVGLE